MKNRNDMSVSNTPERETARLKYDEDVVLIDEKEDARIKGMLDQFGKSLEKVRDKNGWTNEQMLARLNCEYFPNKETISRFIGCKNKRYPSLAQYLDALRAFGPDMELTSIKNRDIRELSNAELIRELERISNELSRRTRQR